MNIFKTKNYKKESLLLPKKDQALLTKQETLLSKDLFDSRLHTKKLQGFGNYLVYSFRITSSYRGIFRIDNESVILFAIGHRKDVYKNLD